MLEFTLIMLAGCFAAGCMYIVAVVYLLAGAWIADRFEKVGAPVWGCYAAIAIAPGAFLLSLYILGNFVTGVLLSGGFH